MVTGATRGEGRNRAARSVDLREVALQVAGVPGPPPSPAGTGKQKPWPCLLSICNLVLAPRSTKPFLSTQTRIQCAMQRREETVRDAVSLS